MHASVRVYAYKPSDGSGFGDIQFATDYNNGITYVMNVLCGSGRVGSRKELPVVNSAARCVVSVEILPIATQQCRNYLYDKS